ncbi:archaeosine synthase subunit alpha [Methanonatronarchaeum sp. AMET-Sl]|uniref:archaeosine synthase subunit alpha n=1 Tax=Methanonatronarchaeum sp. AMET-Sl TaxID=3037654 RepID=UPI00244E5A11|nr:archaeosine synthase subunit alpha [Methanonatronarchaeum sp. AMET-Sl]WGI17386.1 archaeosine synthase subunit alpha [Methanonatronarchaeum sp. AMET-Sl]
MSYFESVTRDGPGRIGVLKSGSFKLETPCLLDIEADVLDLGSSWVSNGFLNNQDSIENPDIVVPLSKRCPPSVDMDFAEYLGEENYRLVDEFDEESFDSLVMPVVGGGRYKNHRERFGYQFSEYHSVLLDMVGDLYIPHELLDVVLSVKKGVGFDTAVYAPAIATPPLIPIMVYMGVDLFDSYRALECSMDDVFFTTSGSQRLEQLSETPCQCNVCLEHDIDSINEMSGDIRQNNIYQHNIAMLKGELKSTRNAIQRGLLREYVEQRVKSKPNLTALLRKLDFDYPDFLMKQTASYRRYRLYANNYESLERPEIKRFIKRVKNRYSPPGSDVAVILPCSAKKPYSKSKSHAIYRRGTKGRGDEVILTSPLGLVPRELEVVYPAQHYDLPVTGVWSEDEKKLIRNCFKHYFSLHQYEKIVVHLEGEMAELCKEVLDPLCKTELTTPNRDPRSSESIKNLDKALNGYPKRTNRFRDMVKSITDYQFRLGLGNRLLEGAEVKGSFPKLRVIGSDGTQYATLVPQYGMIALTIEGVKKVEPTDYFIEIGDFYPKGSLLAPGVINAGNLIRPNDEVWFKGSKAIGVGRAEMSGQEMINSERGIAVKIRHVEEL